MLKGFRDFLMRGNVIDLAVAVIIGAAFNAVVQAFATKVIGGLLAAAGGTPNFDEVSQKINGTEVVYGPFLTAVVSFLITAAVVYFLIVVPVNRISSLRKKGVEPEPVAPAEDIVLLTEIRDLLRQRPTAS